MLHAFLEKSVSLCVFFGKGDGLSISTSPRPILCTTNASFAFSLSTGVAHIVTFPSPTNMILKLSIQILPQKTQRFAELEASLGETDRARSIFELAVHQPLLDMPERLWRAFIEFEAGQGERGRARGLYERLLEKTKHVKVWLGFAEFEAAPLGAEGEGGRGEGEGDEAPGAREQAAREVWNILFFIFSSLCFFWKF